MDDPDTVAPYLDRLTRHDLKRLRAALDGLDEAADWLPEGTVYDLTPGALITIRLPEVMPHPRPPAQVFFHGCRLYGPVVTLPDPDPAAPPPPAGGAEAAAAHPPAVAAPDAEPPRAEGGTDAPPPLPVPVAAAGADAPVVPAPGDPGTASGLAKASPFVGGKPWTEDENARAVEVFARARAEGRGYDQAVQAAADAVGRPFSAVSNRLSSRLKDRVQAARDQLAAAMSAAPATKSDDACMGPEPSAASPAADASSDPAAPPFAAVDPPGAALVPPPPGVADPALAAHVAALPRRQGWTIERDCDLLRLALLGWSPDDVAGELSVSARDVRARLDVLTAGKAWRRADVLTALGGEVPQL